MQPSSLRTPAAFSSKVASFFGVSRIFIDAPR
jgi:hypothetical protein